MAEKANKAELVAEICRQIGLRQALPMSTGSTEPKEVFVEVDRAFGLGLTAKARTKPELAAAIVNSAGFMWLPSYESRGGTVTRDGLTAVLEAVRFFKGEAPSS